jgi:methenyltetrahydrofolate cyclohydrolase
MSRTPDPSRSDTTIEAFLDQLSSRAPTPGGGSAAGLSAALGAALLAMVANYTTGGRFVEIESEMRGYVEELAVLRARSLLGVRADEEAFGAVGAAYGLPRQTDEQRSERSAAIQAALKGAVEPPREIAAICTRLSEIASVLAGKGNRNVLSDVGVGAACARAALEGAFLNVAINASQIVDVSIRTELADTMERMDRDLAALRAVVEDVRVQVAS